MRCDIKKGIFRQISCKNLSTQRCSDCGINICSTHAEQLDSKTVCIKCFTKSKNSSKAAMSDRYYDDDRYFYMSYWAMRSNYYNEYDDYGFDESDYSGFEDTSDEMYDMSDANDDDFLDS
ncbi:MAG: hypothetical protein N4A74_03165 [Carboxylicivirga sp.]|jgi:hypothetical protein|nr:hypothetical protein [Carboxylicivirga sp.]